ncbi:MAG: hypothetical protein A2X94_11985 [Bdellovibrionales bacterium GWB1_55_8]|nr:MAG: hypothetical protein A2X94_11985 [Bdellovibrionales bacterium GWB1_55_8]
MGLNFASANDGYRLDCRYTGTSGKGADRCIVKARACEFLAPDTAVENRECRDGLYVECNGEVLYRDYANHFSRDGFEYIRGIPTAQLEHPPVIKYESEPAPSSHFTISSWLFVNGAQLQGFCDVRAPTLD